MLENPLVPRVTYRQAIAGLERVIREIGPQRLLGAPSNAAPVSARRSPSPLAATIDHQAPSKVSRSFSPSSTVPGNLYFCYVEEEPLRKTGWDPEEKRGCLGLVFYRVARRRVRD